MTRRRRLQLALLLVPILFVALCIAFVYIEAALRDWALLRAS